MREALRFVVFAALLSVVGCAAPARPAQPGDSAPPSATAPKHLVVGITNEPVAFHPDLVPATISGSAGALQDLIHPGLNVTDPQGVVHPVLQDNPATVENGLWKLLPDGRMETTFTIRKGARWHDGTPFTSEDLLFSFTVAKDKDLAAFRNRSLDFADTVEPIDDRTVKVNWNRPFVDANVMFTALARPMPKHLLQDSYTSSKAAFTDLRYWSEDFVGLGPFRLTEWHRGSSLVLKAFDGYTLGRPKLDEIEVRFILDSNTLISNVLSGAVDMPMGHALGVDQALAVRDLWQDGRVSIEPDGWVVAYTQMLDPTPAVVSEVAFRRAALHAINRSELVDSLMAGLTPVAESVFSPNMVEYGETATGIARYPYDQRKALELLAGLGYSPGSDRVLQDRVGQKLTLEVRAYDSRPIHIKTLLPVVDYWKQIGIAAESVALPNQAASDLQQQATFPSFLVLRQPNGLSRVVTLHSSQARLPENRFSGNNNGRYINPELDGLIDRFQSTISRTDRMAIATQIVRHQTEQLPLLPLFYDASGVMVSNRVLNVPASRAPSWNAQEWDVR